MAKSFELLRATISPERRAANEARADEILRDEQAISSAGSHDEGSKISCKDVSSEGKPIIRHTHDRRSL
jgi:hypothetical protein